MRWSTALCLCCFPRFTHALVDCVDPCFLSFHTYKITSGIATASSPLNFSQEPKKERWAVGKEFSFWVLNPAESSDTLYGITGVRCNDLRVNGSCGIKSACKPTTETPRRLSNFLLLVEKWIQSSNWPVVTLTVKSAVLVVARSMLKYEKWSAQWFYDPCSTSGSLFCLMTDKWRDWFIFCRFPGCVKHVMQATANFTNFTTPVVSYFLPSTAAPSTTAAQITVQSKLQEMNTTRIAQGETTTRSAPINRRNTLAPQKATGGCGTVCGIVVAVVVSLIVARVLIVLCFLYKRSRKQDNEPEKEQEPASDSESVITPPPPNKRRKPSPPYPKVITLTQLEELFEMDLDPTQEELLELLTSTIHKAYKHKNVKKCENLAWKRLEELVLEMNFRPVNPIRNERTLLARDTREIAKMAKSRAEHITMMTQRDNTDADWAEKLPPQNKINSHNKAPQAIYDPAQVKRDKTQKTHTSRRQEHTTEGIAEKTQKTNYSSSPQGDSNRADDTQK